MVLRSQGLREEKKNAQIPSMNAAKKLMVEIC